jgi:hypothetical protein
VLSYATTIRALGIGWAMGMGRLGQVVSPLLVGCMLAFGRGSGQIVPIMGTAALVAALFVVISVTPPAAPTRWRCPAPCRDKGERHAAAALAVATGASRTGRPSVPKRIALAAKTGMARSSTVS